jgi:glyoxylase-like metal-dependent hydrolase (beta-lactamase superfamily II)
VAGTNTYVIGECNPYTLIDTGEGKDEYIPILESALRDTYKLTNQDESHISDIIISHWHHDHTGGLDSVLSLLRRMWDEQNTPAPFKPSRIHNLCAIRRKLECGYCIPAPGHIHPHR